MGRKKKYATEEERKAAKAAYLKQYYQDHKGEHSARHKQWQAKHKEEYTAYMKQWQAEHKEERTAYFKQYRAEHKEERNAYNKQYRSSPFGRAANLVGYYKRNDKNAGRGDCTITAEWIMENVFSGQCCHYCGESDWTKLGVDRKDSSLPHTPENCVPCCDCCNKKKHTTSYEEFMDKIQREAS